MPRKSKQNSKAQLIRTIANTYDLSNENAKKRITNSINTLHNAFGITIPSIDYGKQYSLTQHEQNLILADASRASILSKILHVPSLIDDIQKNSLGSDFKDIIRMVSFFLPFYLYKDWSDEDKAFLSSHFLFLVYVSLDILITLTHDRTYCKETAKAQSDNITLLFSSMKTFSPLPAMDITKLLF